MNQKKQVFFGKGVDQCNRLGMFQNGVKGLLGRKGQYLFPVLVEGVHEFHVVLVFGDVVGMSGHGICGFDLKVKAMGSVNP
jgi:hypothetical protein